jgi:hypothetical protein
MAKKRERNKPRTIYVNGERFDAVPFLINTKNSSGRPRLCTMMEEDAGISLAGGEEFMVCYVSQVMQRGGK